MIRFLLNERKALQDQIISQLVAILRHIVDDSLDDSNEGLALYVSYTNKLKITGLYLVCKKVIVTVAIRWILKYWLGNGVEYLLSNRRKRMRLFLVMYNRHTVLS